MLQASENKVQAVAKLCLLGMPGLHARLHTQSKHLSLRKAACETTVNNSARPLTLSNLHRPLFRPLLRPIIKYAWPLSRRRTAACPSCTRPAAAALLTPTPAPPQPTPPRFQSCAVEVRCCRRHHGPTLRTLSMSRWEPSGSCTNAHFSPRSASGSGWKGEGLFGESTCGE